MSSKLLINNIVSDNKLIAWFDMSEIKIGDISLKNKIDNSELVLKLKSKTDGYLSNSNLTYSKPIDFRTIQFTFLATSAYDSLFLFKGKSLIRCYLNVQTVVTATVAGWIETPRKSFNINEKVTVTITYEKDTINIYVNKQLVLSKSNLNVDFTKLYIESWEMDIPDIVQLFDVKFYNYALSKNEI